jgi:ABC-type lipoprotein export system ATPase subunit
MTEAAADALVVVDGVTHVPPGGRMSRAVLRDVSLVVRVGEVVALAGRSGSGKSTLCHLVAGLEPPTSGSILVADVAATDVDDWAVVSLLPQRVGLVPELSVAENVLLPAWLRDRDAALETLETLGLAELADRAADQLSLGEQQRAGIARAFVLRPSLAILDEPTSHQDDEHVELVSKAVDRARLAGTAVLVATHDERLLASATRVVRLTGGVVDHSG